MLSTLSSDTAATLRTIAQSKNDIETFTERESPPQTRCATSRSFRLSGFFSSTRPSVDVSSRIAPEVSYRSE